MEDHLKLYHLLQRAVDALQEQHPEIAAELAVYRDYFGGQPERAPEESVLAEFRRD
jgi:hypothetical protein